MGDVATFDDSSAPAPTITVGTPSASDGTNVSHVTLSLSGQGTNNGSSRTYKVRATNAYGDSDDSNTDTGYRGVGTLQYQWQRSAADSYGSYSDISGATTNPYNDTGAPADGSGRYYRCYLTATRATSQYTSADRGYRRTTVSTVLNSPNNMTSTSDRTPTFSFTGNHADSGPIDYEIMISADMPSSWTEQLPTIDGNQGVDTRWESVSISGDKIVAAVYGGRLYYYNGSSWSEQQPAGNVDKDWQSVSISGDKIVAGEFAKTTHTWNIRGRTIQKLTFRCGIYLRTPLLFRKHYTIYHRGDRRSRTRNILLESEGVQF